MFNQMLKKRKTVTSLFLDQALCFQKQSPEPESKSGPATPPGPEVSATVMPFILLTCLLLSFPLLLNAPLPRLTHYLGFQSPIPVPTTSLEGPSLRSSNPGLFDTLVPTLALTLTHTLADPKSSYLAVLMGRGYSQLSYLGGKIGLLFFALFLYIFISTII